jgi:hypothetical protein
MAISKNKKRYQLSLTPAVVDRFKSLCKRLNLPESTMSNACDELLNNVSDTFQMALDKGNIELSDLMKVMGKQLELLEGEKKSHAEQKRNKATS